jgi:hypothetical protein
MNNSGRAIGTYCTNWCIYSEFNKQQSNTWTMQNIKMTSLSFISSYQRLGDKFTADSFRVKQMEGTEKRDREMTLWGSMLRTFNRSAHLSYSEDGDRILLLNVGRYISNDTGCHIPKDDGFNIQRL